MVIVLKQGVTMRTIAGFQIIQGHDRDAERFIRGSLQISETPLGSGASREID